MVFGTFEFFIFLAAEIAIYWALKKHSALRRLFLLSASAYYYWLVDERFVGLLAIAALITYLAGSIASGQGSVRIKNFLYWTGIAGNLGILLWFKYYDFFRVSAQSFFASIGLSATLPFWEMVFPIGVSFYTFRMISYLADLLRKKYKAERSMLDFGVYAFFFPYLLAGPIVRANDFLPQLKNGGPDQPNDLPAATALFFLGLFKKIVISSWLAETLVDNVFAVPEQIGAAAAWLAVLGYTLQIYCDFSGYSDIAIACAMFMGFSLPPNFTFPYRAKSLTEFWQRWHISFYSWMVEYIYIPLGGSRAGKIRNYANVLIVFTLSGLWHGAAIHYLAWGLWHGIGMCFQRIWKNIKRILSPVSDFPKITFLTDIGGWFATFLFVGLGWIFFRSENLERAQALASSLFRSNSDSPVPAATLFIVCAIFLFVSFEREMLSFLTKIQDIMPIRAWLLFWIVIGLIIYRLAPQTVPPFIYFSF
jgi:alginate O-acetyltransferase complex protein AlgI